MIKGTVENCRDQLSRAEKQAADMAIDFARAIDGYERFRKEKA
jgi:hypothetical protein